MMIMRVITLVNYIINKNNDNNNIPNNGYSIINDYNDNDDHNHNNDIHN